MTLSDLRDHLGVQLSVITNWRTRFDDFPQPVPDRRRGRAAIYRSSELDAWLRAHGKRPLAVAPAHDLFREVLTALPDVDEGSESDSGRAGWAFAVTALGVLEAAKPGELVKEHGLFVRPLDLLRSLPEDLQERLRTFGESDDVGAIADAVRNQFAASKRNGWFSDSPTVSTLLAGLTDPSDNIHDPCCGTGNLLAAAGRAARAAGLTPLLRGQDIDPALAAGALALLLAEGFDAEVLPGNVLAAGGNRFPVEAERSVAVITNPPLDHRLTPGDVSDADTRWVYGTPVRDGTNAWVQVALSHLPEGDGTLDAARAAVVVPIDWLRESGSSRSEAVRLRAALTRQGLVEAVLTVPNLGGRTRASVAGILVLSSVPKPGAEVLLIDLSREHSSSQRTSPVLAPDVIEHALEQVRRHRQGSNSAAADSDAVVVSFEEIAGNDFVLHPGPYRRVSADELIRRARPVASVTTNRSAPRAPGRFEGPLADVLLELRKALDAEVPQDARRSARYIDELARDVASVVDSGGRVTTLGDLERDGVLRVAAGHQLQKVLGSTTAAEPIVLLTTAGQDFGRVELAEANLAEPRRRGLVAFAALDLDARYLAAWLRSHTVQEALKRAASAGVRSNASVSAADVRNLPAWLPNRTAQQKIAAAWNSQDDVRAAAAAHRRYADRLEEALDRALLEMLANPDRDS